MKTTAMPNASGEIYLLFQLRCCTHRLLYIVPQIIRHELHSLQNLPPHALPLGSIPCPVYQDILTPAHSQYQNQIDIWRAHAYAPSGENVSVNITMAYLPLGKAKEMVLPVSLIMS